MSQFITFGPFDLPFQIINGLKQIYKPKKEFWENPEHSKYADMQGCYVFAIKTKAYMPQYVGLTSKTFKQEIFTDHKLGAYNRALIKYRKGLPVMFFVAHPRQRGKTNLKEIKEVENFLIQNGVTINPDLRNIRGTKQPTWSIKNVVRAKRGRPNQTESKFKKMMGLYH